MRFGKILGFFVPMIIFSFIPISALGVPQVNGINGSVLHNQVLTITGSAFGTKPTGDAPYRWDNFTSGTVGQIVTGWSGGTGANIAKYATAPAGRVNARASLHAFNSTNGSNVSLCANDSAGYQMLYIDYWYYLDKLSGDSRNFKPWRLYGGNPQDSLELNPVMFCSGSGALMVATDTRGSTPSATYGNDTQTNRVWIHEQVVLKQSSPGVADGVIQRYRNSVPWYIFSGAYMTRSSAQTGPWNQIRIGHYWAMDGADACSANPGVNLYITDLYIDRTWARVEIGNNSVYANCTHREIQIPQSWSTGSISVNLNQGSFSSAESLYVFVIDSNNVPSPGFGPVTFAAGGGLIPSPPMNLIIR